MNESMKKMLHDVELNNPAEKEEIEKVEKELSIVFPKNYKNFMIESNGLEGEIGEISYLVIWSIDEIIELNEEYEVEEYMPNLIYFGSDGGDMAYAFDKENNMEIIEIPFDSIHIEDKELLGKNFEEFIQNLFERKE